jgi:SAM-dependent methyltransferase
MDFLVKVHDRYTNSDIAKRLLVKDSPGYQGDILKHNWHLLHRWIRVEEVLQTGIPLRDPKKKRTPEELRAFIDGMSNIARISAVMLWELVDLTGRKRLLDAGGGPGSYAFHACELFPELEAVVFDLPEVEPIFEEHRAAAGMQERVRFAAGDVHSDPLPEGCDVALLSNVIHSWSFEQNRALISRLDAALKPGALLLIKDFFISDDGTEPLFSALFAVNMLIGTQSGACYSRRQVESWLEGTSFEPKGMMQLTEQAGVLLAEKRKK